MKLAKVKQTEGGFREYEVATGQGLKFLSIRKLKEGSTHRVTRNFSEQLKKPVSD